ncbi:MAG: deoxyribodipyrimidine photo-lyase, partial [Bacteroidota bacterium]
MGRVIVWFRNDLRVKDNKALSQACSNGNIVFPVYVLDRRLLETTALGFSRSGSFRIEFLLESLAELRGYLKKLGADLILRVGNPEEVVSRLADELRVEAIHCSKEIAHEELQQVHRMEQKLQGKGIEVKDHWQSTLFHEDDVPWPVKQVPDVFTKFRKESEKTVEIRSEFKAPNKIHFQHEVESGELPTLKDLGIEREKRSKKAVLPFKGGESEAWKRLNGYFWKDDLLKRYKYTRNELIGKDYSSKFSPWLALGCISAKS